MIEPGLDTGYRDKNGEISRRLGKIPVGTLRQLYGADFAPDFKDTDTLSDILGKLDEASLTKLIKDLHAGVLAGGAAPAEARFSMSFPASGCRCPTPQSESNSALERIQTVLQPYGSRLSPTLTSIRQKKKLRSLAA
jgi:hypothetical protein